MLGNLMSNKASIQRRGVVAATGGANYTWTDIYSNIGVSIQPASSSLHLSYDARKQNVTHSIFTNKQIVNVAVGDRVLFGSRTLLVQGVFNLIELKRVWRLDCLEYADSE
jgi:hypothetical protein